MYFFWARCVPCVTLICMGLIGVLRGYSTKKGLLSILSGFSLRPKFLDMQNESVGLQGICFHVNQ